MSAEQRQRLSEREQRVLVLAPLGRDAQLVAEVLERTGIAAVRCSSMQEVCDRLEHGAGALLLAEETLTRTAVACLCRALRAQPTWSDLPIVVSVGEGETTEARMRAVSALEPSGNVSILERPVRVFTLVVTLQAALRARRRQYHLRDVLLEQQAQMQELRAERELRGRFVSMLAHDLGGPLAAASMAFELLNVGADLAEPRRKYAIKLAKNLKRIEQMVKNLLDASRIRAGQPLPIRLEPCELNQIARDVADELNDMHGARVVLAANESVRGVWSEQDLRRALWNLTSNAIKYGAAGAPVTIAISLAGTRARASVHNAGQPLEEADRKRIFEPFARLTSAGAGGKVGWGLGLTLVRGCAEAHGGSVELTSDAHAGTTFTLELPLDARPFQAQADAGTPRAESRN